MHISKGSTPKLNYDIHLRLSAEDIETLKLVRKGYRQATNSSAIRASLGMALDNLKK